MSFQLIYFAQTIAGINVVKVPVGATRVHFGAIFDKQPKGPNPLYTNNVRFDLQMKADKGPLVSYFGSDILVLGGWVPINQSAKFITVHATTTTPILGASATFEVP